MKKHKLTCDDNIREDLPMMATDLIQLTTHN